MVAGRQPGHRVATVLGFIAVTAATINVVGGFLITDRMLKMFRRDPKPKAGAALEQKAGGAGR